MSATAPKLLCQFCSEPWDQHVTYYEAASIPPGARQAVFLGVDIRGMYCLVPNGDGHHETALADAGDQDADNAIGPDNQRNPENP